MNTDSKKAKKIILRGNDKQAIIRKACAYYNCLANELLAAKLAPKKDNSCTFNFAITLKAKPTAINKPSSANSQTNKPTVDPVTEQVKQQVKPLSIKKSKTKLYGVFQPTPNEEIDDFAVFYFTKLSKSWKLIVTQEKMAEYWSRANEKGSAITMILAHLVEPKKIEKKTLENKFFNPFNQHLRPIIYFIEIRWKFWSLLWIFSPRFFHHPDCSRVHFTSR